MSIEVEHDVKAIPLDANLQKEVERLAADGWELMPGVTPVGIYHIIRAKERDKALSAGGVGRLTIDESKVFILRDDKVVQ